MGTVIQASELAIGDLYRVHVGPFGGQPGMAIVRIVTNSRMVKTVETYQVLETTALDGTRRGEISLRADLAVERLNEISKAEIVAGLDYLPSGDQLNIVYFEMRFYA